MLNIKSIDMNTVDIGYLILGYGCCRSNGKVCSKWRLCYCKYDWKKILKYVCKKGDVRLMKYLWGDVGIGIKYFRKYHRKICKRICRGGCVDLARYLVSDMGLGIEYFDLYGMCEIVCERGYIDFVKFLFCEAEVTVSDFYACYLAITNGHVDILRFLLGRVDVKYFRNHDGICLASGKGYVDVLRFLFYEVGLVLEDFRGDSINDKDSVWHDAVMCGQVEVLRFLFYEVGMRVKKIKSCGQIGVLKFLVEDVGVGIGDFRMCSSECRNYLNSREILGYLIGVVGLGIEDFGVCRTKMWDGELCYWHSCVGLMFGKK